MGGKGSGKRDKRPKRRQVMGLLGGVLETDIPTRVIGVEQMAEDVIPMACPNCHSVTMWSRGEWEGHCMCGKIIVKTVGSVRFALHRQRQPRYYEG